MFKVDNKDTRTTPMAWCFCLIFKCRHVLNNFRFYFFLWKLLKSLSRLFLTNFNYLLKLLVKVTAILRKHLLRFLLYFIIISLFSIFAYVLLVFHVSYLYVCFVNISVYLLSEIPIRLSNLFCTNILFLLMLMLMLKRYA